MARQAMQELNDNAVAASSSDIAMRFIVYSTYSTNPFKYSPSGW